MARSLNKVELIGNITKDVELKYTPSGAAVCTFSIATNRNWTTDSGEKKEDAEFHRIVAWNKLAELCGQLLSKGRKVYVEGRLQTRKWTGQDGVDKYTTEVVINDMIILDSKGAGASSGDDYGVSDKDLSDIPVYDENKTKVEPKVTAKEENVTSEAVDDDIPF
jgi:single-strand DNA-binding protein